MRMMILLLGILAACRQDPPAGPPGAPVPSVSLLPATGGGFAYVANSNSGNVAVIATATNTGTSTIPVSEAPVGVAVTPAGDFAYVTNANSDNVSVIQTSTNSVTATVTVGDAPIGIAITPDAAFAYVVNSNSDNVSVIRTSTTAVTATVAVGDAPQSVAITPDGAFAYVVNPNSGTVSVIQTSSNTVVATVTVGGSPNDVAITPDGTRAYVTSASTDNVSVIETSTNTVSTSVTVGDHPVGLAIRPDGAFAYVVNFVSQDVSVIQTSDNTVTAIIPVGQGPQGGVAFTSDGDFVYVTNYQSDNVSVIQTSTNAVTATVSVGDGPNGIAITPSRLALTDFCNGADDRDDTRCIRDWIRAGSQSPNTKLYAPAGTYLYGESFPLYSGLHFECARSNQTTFRNNGGTGLFLAAASPVHGVRIANCGFDVRGSTSNFLAVIAVNPGGIEPSNDIDVSGNRIYDSAIPGQMSKQQRQYILLLNCHDCRVEDNYLSEGGRIKLGQPGRRLVIRNNTVEQANDNAITVVDISAEPNVSDDISIQDNRIVDPLAIGIFFGADGEQQTASSLTTRHVLIENNNIEGNWRLACIAGTLPSISDAVRVIGNTCVKTGPTIQFAAGILIKRTNRPQRRATNIEIEQNMVSATVPAGAVALDYGGVFFSGKFDGVRVVGNEIRNVGPRAIFIHRSADIIDATIAGNTLIGGSIVIDGSVQGVVQTGSMIAARRDHKAILLDNGKVLIVGGTVGGAELYDPTTQTFINVGPVAHGQGVAAAKLADGRVLVVGGGIGVIPAHLFDPSTNTFSETAGTPNVLLNYRTATLLADGRVLFAGGQDLVDGLPQSHAVAEIFDPANESFTAVGNLNDDRSNHAATLLPDGRVLLVGGTQTTTPGSGVCLSSAELFDPASETFSLTGSMAEGRCGLGITGITLLNNGRVLVVGWTGATAELYNPGSGTFSATGNMVGPHTAGSATLLLDGRVLVTGGATGGDGPNTTATVELYNPMAGTFTLSTSLSVPRQEQTATRLVNGRVLIAGGFDSSNNADLGSAELYLTGP